MKFFVSISCILLVIFSSGCLKEDKPVPPQDEELSFEIDLDKVGTEYKHPLNFAFRAPRGWHESDSVLFNNAVRALDAALAGQNKFSIKPLYMFIDSASNDMLNVSHVQLNEDSAAKNKINAYLRTLQISDDTARVKKGSFNKDRVHFTQLLIQNPESVNFRLLFLNGKKDIIQFDYIVQRKNYMNTLRSVESSIGTIKLTNKEEL